jgi:hypothetical protein
LTTWQENLTANQFVRVFSSGAASRLMRPQIKLVPDVWFQKLTAEQFVSLVSSSSLMSRIANPECRELLAAWTEKFEPKDPIRLMTRASLMSRICNIFMRVLVIEIQLRDAWIALFPSRLIGAPLLLAVSTAFGKVDDAVPFFNCAQPLLLTDDGVARLFLRVINALSTEATQRLFVDCFDRYPGIDFQRIPCNPDGNLSNEIGLFLIQACQSNIKPSDVSNVIRDEYCPIGKVFTTANKAVLVSDKKTQLQNTGRNSQHIHQIISQAD